MSDLKSRVLVLLAGMPGVSVGNLSALKAELPDYNRTIPSRNGGKKSGAAAIKRAAAKRRNQRRK